MDKEIPNYEMTTEEWNNTYWDFVNLTVVNGYTFYLSGNGRHICAKTNEVTISEDANYYTEAHSALAFDTEENIYKIFADPIGYDNMCAVAALNDGSIFCTTPYIDGNFTRNAYVFSMQEETSYVTIENWISTQYGIEFPSDKIPYTGTPFISGYENLIGAYYTDYSGTTSFYYIKTELSTGVETIRPDTPFTVYTENGVLYINALEKQSVNLYSIEGRLLKQVIVSEGETTIHGLSKGIYLVNNQKVVVR